MPRKTFDVSEPSYLDSLPHGSLSSYIRAVIDLRLEQCRSAVLLLTAAGRTREEVVALLHAASVPAARYAETGLLELRDDAREAVALLWHEAELTGLDGEDLLAALDGAHA